MNQAVFELNGKYFVYACDPNGEATGDPLAGPFDTPDAAKAALNAQGQTASQPATNAAPKPQPVKATSAAANVIIDNLTGKVAALESELNGLKARMSAAPTAAGGFAQVKPADADQPFKRLGEQLKAIHTVRTNGAGAEMAYNKLMAVKALGMNEEAPADGGYALQPTFVPGIWQRTYDTSLLAKSCRPQEIGENSNTLIINAIAETSRATGSRYGGLQGYWIAPGTSATPSRPKLRPIELRLKKLAALMYATDELLADITALESLANQAVPEELGFMLDDAIWEGGGAGIPLGITNSPVFLAIAKEAGQATGTIVMENITKMWSRLWPRSQKNANWYYNTDAFPQLMSLGLGIGVGGVPVFLPPGGISGSPYATLFGRPLIPIEQASTVGTVGDLVLADLSQYVLARKGDIQSAVSIHVAFLTDETAFRWIMRVDGQPIWDSVLTPFKGTNTQSPFVAVATR